ncbi:MAG TPA: hypothetical protein VJU83_00595 [Burkholderiales bacterium]|nr:hypothetical protein [Burkholderiales bacterium]
MIDQPVIAFINHVLGQEAWARVRLQGFSGKRIHVRAGLIDAYWLIDEQGFCKADKASGTPADLSLQVPATAWLGLMQRDPGALKAVQIGGDTDLAEAIQFIFLNIRWDVEEDLSRIVGDIAAHRLVSGGRAFIDWQRDAAQRFGENFAEYWREEAGLLATRGEINRYVAEVEELRDAVARLEKRMDGLYAEPPTPP